MKRIHYFYLLVIFALLLTVVIYAVSISATGRLLPVNNESRKLSVSFLPVGQGDSILIEAPGGKKVLIDGGPGRKSAQLLGDRLGPLEHKLDIMVLTHPHDDHVSGLVEVLDKYEVGSIYYSGAIHDSPAFIEWLKKIKDKKIPLLIVEKRMIADLGEGCILEFLHPDKESVSGNKDNLNNTSIVIRLSYGATSFLFAGDVEEETEKLLSEKYGDYLRSDVLKVAHHGSDSSSGADFLALVKPAIAVIQYGKDNSFGHPSRRVIRRFERISAKILDTSVNAIILESDAKSVILAE